MAHKYNLYFAIIFGKEELDHRGKQVVLHLQFWPDIHLNKDKLHLSKYENLAFTDFLLDNDWWRHDNSNNFEIRKIYPLQILIAKGKDNESYFINKSDTELSPDSEK